MHRQSLNIHNLIAGGRKLELYSYNYTQSLLFCDIIPVLIFKNAEFTNHICNFSGTNRLITSALMETTIKQNGNPAALN